MAKKQTAQQNSEQPEYLGHTCGECANGTFAEEHSNMDHAGKPICLTCPNRQFYILRTERACSKWKKRKEKN